MNAPSAAPRLNTDALDFAEEDWDQPIEFFDGCWVIANRHCPALNQTMEVNNRVFVFRLVDKRDRCTLVVLGCADQRSIDAVKGHASVMIVPSGEDSTERSPP